MTSHPFASSAYGAQFTRLRSDGAGTRDRTRDRAASGARLGSTGIGKGASMPHGFLAPKLSTGHLWTSVALIHTPAGDLELTWGNVEPGRSDAQGERPCVCHHPRDPRAT